MSKFIRKIGLHYVTASNGLIAFEKYSNSAQRYAFILMGKPRAILWFSRNHPFADLLTPVSDISMPVMDGLVATRKIREYEKSNGLKPSCIMAVTAVASIETQEAALKAGVNDFLVKPLSLARLRESMLVWRPKTHYLLLLLNSAQSKYTRKGLDLRVPCTKPGRSIPTSSNYYQ